MLTLERIKWKQNADIQFFVEENSGSLFLFLRSIP